MWIIIGAFAAAGRQRIQLQLCEVIYTERSDIAWLLSGSAMQMKSRLYPLVVSAPKSGSTDWTAWLVTGALSLCRRHMYKLAAKPISADKSGHEVQRQPASCRPERVEVDRDRVRQLPFGAFRITEIAGSGIRSRKYS